MKEWLEQLKNGKKDQILILLLLGILLVVIAWPIDSGISDDSSVTAEQITDGYEAAGSAAAAVSGSGEILSGDSAIAADLEERLEQILSQVDGIGNVKTMITLKSGGRKVVEKDTQQSESKEESTNESGSSVSEQTGSSESTIYEQDSDGSDTPFVTEELFPEILGVLVIAQGADSSAVVTEITEAVMALFGVEAHKIKVMKME